MGIDAPYQAWVLLRISFSYLIPYYMRLSLYLLFAISIITQLTGYGQAGYQVKYTGWTRHLQGNPGRSVYAAGDTIQFVDPVSGGYAYNALDKGWHHQTDSILAGNLTGAAPAGAAGSGNVGVLVLANGYMFHTADRWRTTTHYARQAGFATDWQAFSTDDGLLAVSEGMIFRSDDGLTWQATGGSQNNRGFGLAVYGAKVAVAFSDSLYISSNYGRTFQSQALGIATLNVKALAMGDINTYYLVADDNLYKKTATTAWMMPAALPLSGARVTGMAFKDANHGVITCTSTLTRYIYTADGGQTLTGLDDDRVGTRATPLRAGGKLFIRSDNSLAELADDGSLVPHFDYMADQDVRAIYLGRGGLGLAAMSRTCMVTHNHGRTYATVRMPLVGADFAAAFAHNDSILLLADQQGAIFRSANGGASWQTVRVAQPGAPLPLQFEATAENILVMKSEGQGVYSADYGRSWDYLPTGGLPNLRPDGKVVVLDHNNTNGGRTVYLITPGVSALPVLGQYPAIVYTVLGGAMADTSVGYFLTRLSGGSLHRTADGGRTWTELTDLTRRAAGSLRASVVRSFGHDTIALYAPNAFARRFFTSIDGGQRFDTIALAGTHTILTSSRVAFIGPGLERWTTYTRQGVGGGVFFTKEARQLATSTRQAHPNLALLRLVPNPTTGFVICSVANEPAVSVRLYTANGIVITQSQSLCAGVLHLAGVAPGIYQIVAQNAAGAMGCGRLVVE